MNRLTVPFVIIVLALFGAVSTGCGGTDEIGKKAAEKAIESQTGGDVEIDTDKNGEGSVTFKDKDGNETKVTSGADTDLPDDWPKELALPDGAKILVATSTPSPQGTVSTVSATTKDSVGDVIAALDKHLAGWKQDSKADLGSGDDQLATRSYSNGENQVQITVGKNSSSGDPTMLTIALTKK